MTLKTISRSSTALTINRVSKLLKIVVISVSSLKGTTLRNKGIIFQIFWVFFVRSGTSGTSFVIEEEDEIRLNSNLNQGPHFAW